MSRAARRRLLLALVPAALCAALLAAADPRGDFPLNDDFQYADAAIRLARGGGLRLSQWAYGSQITHIALGALAVRLFGASDWSLRLWTMALGCGAAGVAALFAARFGAGEAGALLAGLVLAGDPLHLAMSASFHMEVTLLACLLAAAWALCVYDEGGDMRALAAASAGLGLAALARQTATLAAPCAAGLLWARGRLGRREAAAFAVPLGLLLGGWWLWFRLIHGSTWAALTQGPSLGLDWRQTLPSARRVSAVLQTSAFLLAPCALAALPVVLRLGRPRLGEAAVLAAVAAAAVDGWLCSGTPPMTNVLTRRGLGVVTLNAADAKAAGWWGDRRLWGAVGWLALASSLVLVRLLWPRAREGGGARRGRLLLAAAAGPVLAAALLGGNYDRYLLAWLPLAAAAAVWAAGGGLRAAPGLALAVLMGLWSAAGLRDYFAWNRARWEAGLRAVARGAPPGKVENGFDWDGRYTLDANMERLLRERSPASIGMWDWMRLNRVVALTSFSSSPPRSDFVLVDSVPYRTPLAPGTRRIYLYGLKAATR